MKRVLTILLLVALALTGAEAAKRDQKTVKKEKQKTEQDIKKASTQIDANNKKVKDGLRQLDDLRQKVDEQNVKISHVSAAIDSVSVEVNLLNDSIDSLNDRLERLQKSYGKTLRKMQSHRAPSNTLSYLFSSESVRQAYRRLRYLRRFTQWRRIKGEEIIALRGVLDEKKERAEQLLAQRTSLLTDLNLSTKELELSKNEISSTVANLKKENASLQKYLEEKKKKAANLDRELQKLIASSKPAPVSNKPAAKAPGSSDKPDASPKNTTPKLPESTSFEGSKGRLPFPVDGKYKIVGYFGRHQHPELSQVYIENNGIDIQVLGGGKARCVYDGVVSGVFRDDEFSMVVMVRHGNYITIYANLSNANVSDGQRLTSGQTIGSVADDPDRPDRKVLHFEVRNESAKLDPLTWLR